MNKKNIGQHKKYLIVPIIKNPYNRVGPKEWQDWYRQVKLVVKVAKKIKDTGGEAIIAILSNFHPKGKPSEIEIYTQLLKKLSPELDIRTYRETNSTFEQVERGFALGREFSAEVVFVSTWMQYPRVRYLARGLEAMHYGVFGIPQPAFAFIDPIALILVPIGDLFGVSKPIRRVIVRQREKGRIL